jgi:hypothetical protein
MPRQLADMCQAGLAKYDFEIVRKRAKLFRGSLVALLAQYSKMK